MGNVTACICSDGYRGVTFCISSINEISFMSLEAFTVKKHGSALRFTRKLPSYAALVDPKSRAQVHDAQTPD